MRPLLTGLALAAAGVGAALVGAALVGLALHRGGEPAVAIVAAAALVALPPIAFAATWRHPATPLAVGSLAWSLLVWAVLPLYFPGERDEALLTAMTFGEGAMHAEPLATAAPLPQLAEALVATPPPPAADLVRPDQIALHYDGEGRRMTVEVTIEHGGVARELVMLLDTGATFTTLHPDVLAELGLPVNDASPRIALQTAGGEREASLHLLDRLWLGDLPIDGVAIATCEACASDEVAGLLGLNVTGGFNLAIDADRHEVLFTRRADASRHVDIKPFVEIGATIQQIGDRVRARPWLRNRAGRPIPRAEVALRCRDEAWIVPLGPIAAGDRATGERRLPPHTPCARYEIALHAAEW